MRGIKIEDADKSGNIDKLLKYHCSNARGFFKKAAAESSIVDLLVREKGFEVEGNHLEKIEEENGKATYLFPKKLGTYKKGTYALEIEIPQDVDIGKKVKKLFKKPRRFIGWAAVGALIGLVGAVFFDRELIKIDNAYLNTLITALMVGGPAYLMERFEIKRYANKFLKENKENMKYNDEKPLDYDIIKKVA